MIITKMAQTRSARDLINGSATNSINTFNPLIYIDFFGLPTLYPVQFMGMLSGQGLLKQGLQQRVRCIRVELDIDFCGHVIGKVK